MNNSENHKLPFVKFLIPAIFLYSSFSLATSFDDGIFLSLLNFTSSALSGIYLLQLLEINFSEFKINAVRIIAITSSLIVVISALLLLTNNFSI